MHPRAAENIYQAHIRFPAERSLPVPSLHFGSGKQTLLEDLHGSLYDFQQDDLPLSCACKAQAATVRNALSQRKGPSHHAFSKYQAVWMYTHSHNHSQRSDTSPFLSYMDHNNMHDNHPVSWQNQPLQKADALYYV